MNSDTDRLWSWEEARDSCLQRLQEAWGYGSRVAKPGIPYVIQGAAAGITFVGGLAGIQGVAYACRISCASPHIGPLFGMVGVGLASAAGGQVSKAVGRWQAGLEPWPREGLAAIRGEEVLLDAALGILAYKALGGMFKNVNPSDLRYPGSFARSSIAANGAQYSTVKQRKDIVSLFRRYGCHHCGRRTGECIGDHMPPNKFVWPEGTRSKVVTASQNVFVKALRQVTRRKGPARTNSGTLKAAERVAQRLFPQCTKCSEKQSVAVKLGRQVLVVHKRLGLPESCYYAGVFAGLRHYVDPTIERRRAHKTDGPTRHH
ncbi:hypothetical protein KFL_000060560 [Klebsormidium nitens]|uniref:Uncharacterized protein n=1 Tax=Klebsormidium nitens TaxID=105231 RepID=A0A0U9HJV9_KLENI|nr:hypothetical protein KFL_000060560 [Klebsormidium nitens]|eukprot:GAQ77991.1 hypothetical protein KFL_000060560 [Klebsormidium nitens]